MTVLLSPSPRIKEWTNAGQPAAGYKLYTYLANTTTPATTYTSKAGTVANANPVILDARGEATVYLTPGVVYDFVLKTDNDALVRTDEDVTAQSSDASAVAFLQAGTGAVERTTQDKLREVEVSVVDFGAVGDGTTDDTEAVQAALDSGASVVVLPPGKVFRWAGNGPTVPSNVTVKGHGAAILQPNKDTAATVSTGSEYCGLRIAEGSENVTIEGVEFRGPFFETTVVPAYRSIGVHVSGRYDSYFYNNANYPSQPATAPTSTSSNITIRFCKFNGWGQSAVLADQIDGFYAHHNDITNCGRDGIRMYGCQYSDVTENYVEGMGPGFSTEGTAPNLNVYGISATRVYNSAAGDGTTGTYRPCRYCTISRNVVRNCYTWKSIDTHGGTDLVFNDNIIINSHIGIGIDKGGYNLTDGYAPPRRIKVQGNYIYNDRAHAAGARCGIFAVAHDATTENFGEDLDIIGNTVIGYGTDTTDGNIVVSNFRRGTIAENIIKGGMRAGIEFQGVAEDFQVRGGVIADIGITSASACRGVSCNSTSVRVAIDGIAFRKSDTADTMVAVSLAGAPAAGYGVKMGTMCLFQGTVTKTNAAASLDATSPYAHRVLASGNVTNSGAATLSGGRGVASVSRAAAGQVTITLNEAASSTGLMFILVTAKGNVDRRVAVNVTSTTTFDVYTRDAAGALTDTGFYFEVKGY